MAVAAGAAASKRPPSSDLAVRRLRLNSNNPQVHCQDVRQIHPFTHVNQHPHRRYGINTSTTQNLRYRFWLR
jgi:hypothetical protein